MASSLVALRFKSKPQTFRFFSSAAPPPSSDQDAAAEDDHPASSPFTDVKSLLRRPSAGTRRIPLNPPKPDIASSPIPKVASLDEIRKNLSEFRRRSAPPSGKSISFQELYKNSFLNRPETEDTGSDPAHSPVRFSSDTIRESLRRLVGRDSSERGLSSPFREAGDMKGFPSLRSLNERQNLPLKGPGRTSEALPRSIFGRELERKEEVEKERRTELLKTYSYEELGEKLRMLRPKGDEGKGPSFSLEELNERLASLREMEKAAKSNIGDVFSELKGGLQTLRDADIAKKASSNVSRLLILSHIRGEVTPDYMLHPPKELLVEKYFHPDLMSSAEKLKLELKRVRDEFKMSESDCGSTRVQVAQLTTKIKHLSSVLHKKDKHSQRGLQAMVQRRKKLLKYLRRTDWDSYCSTLSKLGLRDAPDYRI